jgi:predicted transposase YdaD
MPYITNIERSGRRTGLQQGLQEGKQPRKQQGAVLLLKRLLRRRFGALPEAIERKLDEAGAAELETLADRVLDAKSLLDVFPQ